MLRDLIDVTYFLLADAADEKGRRRLDRILEAPLDPPPAVVQARRPHPDAGAAELLRMMRG